MPKFPTNTTAVVWDFNGTILNDVDLAANAVNVMLRKRSLPELSRERHRHLLCFPIADYYRALGLDLETETHKDLADEFHEGYLAGVGSCGMNEGVPELLDAFRQANIAQYVLSAAEESMLLSWVRLLGIESCFDGVYGLTDRLAGSKTDRGRDLMNTHGLDPKTTLLIGDTDHDAEVAAALGCHPVIVLQGHQTRDRINGIPCTIFETFADLKHVLAAAG